MSPLDFGSRELTIPKRSRLESPGSYFLVFRGGFLRVETCQTHITLLQRPTGFLQFVCVPMWQDSCGLGIPSNGGDIVREVSPKCLNSSGLGSNYSNLPRLMGFPCFQTLFSSRVLFSLHQQTDPTVSPRKQNHDLPGSHMSNEKFGPKRLFKGFVGDDILPSYMWIIINHYEDPY